MNENYSADNGALDSAEVLAETSKTDIVPDDNSSDINDVLTEGMTKTKAFSDSLKRMSERKVSEALKKERAKYSGFDELMNTLDRLGYGSNALEASERIKGRVLEDAFRQKLQKELIDENEFVVEAKRIIDEDTFKRDLAKVKEAYPECKAKSVEELGEIFMTLMATGAVDAVSAYSAQLKHDEMNVRKEPVSTGSLSSSDVFSEQTYFTPEEAKRIPRKALKQNPSLMERLRKSMADW